MASYLMLFRGGEIAQRNWTPTQVENYYQKWSDWSVRLRQTGTWVAGHPLESEGRVLGPDVSTVTDGPFAETKEVLGGFVLFEAADMDEAERIAAGCPIFEAKGRVEVRPVVETGLCSEAIESRRSAAGRS